METLEIGTVVSVWTKKNLHFKGPVVDKSPSWLVIEDIKTRHVMIFNTDEIIQVEVLANG